MRHTKPEFLSIEATQVLFLLVTILNVLRLIAGDGHCAAQARWLPMTGLSTPPGRQARPDRGLYSAGGLCWVPGGTRQRAAGRHL